MSHAIPNLEDFIAPLIKTLTSNTNLAHWSLFTTWSQGSTLAVKDNLGGNVHTPAKQTEALGVHYKLIWQDQSISRGRLERSQVTESPHPTQWLEDAKQNAFKDPPAATIADPPHSVPNPNIYSETVATWANGDVDTLQDRRKAIDPYLEEIQSSLWSGSFWARRGVSHLMNSKGLNLASKGTRTGWSVYFDGKHGDGFDGRELDSTSAFKSRLHTLGHRLKAAKTPCDDFSSGPCLVWLAPPVVERLLLGTLFRSLDGATIAHGEGVFKKEDFNRKDAVLREDCELSFNPTLDLKVGSYRFTSEGIPTSKTELIHQGRLVQPLLNLKYANKLNLPPTSHPHGSDTYNFELGTSCTLEEGLERTSGGIQVWSVLGLHTLDGSSGDFSLSAPHALVIDDGKLKSSLAITMNGNVFEALRSPKTFTVSVPGEDLPAVVIEVEVQPRKGVSAT